MSKVYTDSIEKRTGGTAITLPATGKWPLANIADDAIGTAQLSATGTASATTFLRGDNAWVGAGISHASLWRMTATFTGSKDPIDANLAVATDVGQGVLGSAMTESSGVFTFPSTGYWNVTATFTFNRASSQDPAMGVIKYTANNGGAWSPVTQMYDYLHSAAQMYGTVNGNCILDITDTANQKVSFKVSQDGASNNTSGSSTVNYTYFNFVKLADT